MATKHAWLALLAALACVAVAGMEVEVDGHGLVVVEGEEVHDVKESDEEEAYVPDFEPTKEWKDILPGQAVPPGLHVRLNLATGRRQAKMMDAIHLPQANLERLARAELIEKMKAEGTLAKFRPTMADIADRGKLEDLAEIFCAVNDIEEEYCGQAVVDETRRDFGLGAKLQVEQGLVVLVDGDEQLFKPSMVEVENDEKLKAAAQLFCDQHHAEGAECAQAVYDQARVEFGFTASEKRRRRRPLWKCSLTDPTKPCEPGAGMDPGLAPMSKHKAKSKEEILLQLPSPDPELLGALKSRTGSKLSEEQMAEIIDRVWKRRQSELDEAMKNVKTAAQSMVELKDKLLDKEIQIADRVQTLTDLEWYVQDIDNAGDLDAIGGFDVVIEQLSDPEEIVAATAAWVVGSAVKNHAKAQYQALEKDVLAPLLALMGRGLQPDAGRAAIHGAGKALYALGAFTRSNAATQEAFRESDGVELLAQAIAVDATAFATEEGRALQAKLQRKSVGLVGDLLRGADNIRDSDAALKEKLHSSRWCGLMAQVLSMQVSTQHQVLHNAGDQMSEEALSTATLMMDITTTALESVAESGAKAVAEIKQQAAIEVKTLQARVKALLSEALTLKRNGDIPAAKREMAAVALLRERMTEVQQPTFAEEEAVRVSQLAAARRAEAAACHAAFRTEPVRGSLRASAAHWAVLAKDDDEYAEELRASAQALLTRLQAPEDVDANDL